MTVYHRRTLGIVGGRTAAAIACFREFQQYHKANGVDYQLQIPFGGESMRMSMVAGLAGLGEIEKLYRGAMADPVFQDLSAKNAQNIIAGSSHDIFMREVISPARPSAGPLTVIRSSGILPGRNSYVHGIMKELVEYLEANGVGYFASVPAVAGNIHRTAMVGRFAGAAELEAFSAKVYADPKWHEIIGRNAVNIVPGSVSDQMWITI